mgnify:CR=1 FL=1
MEAKVTFIALVVLGLPFNRTSLLVNPGAAATGPLGNSFGKPEGNFGIGRLDRVTAVTDIASHFNAKVPTDGSHGTLTGHGGTQHFAALQNDLLAFPAHADDGTAGHVGNEAREELLFLEVSVVLLHVVLSGSSELHGDELVTLLFKTANNLANEAALDAIWLDLQGNVSAWSVAVKGERTMMYVRSMVTMIGGGICVRME